MLLRVHHPNKSNKSERHGAFQAPVHNQSGHLTRNTCGCGGTATHGGTEGKHTYGKRNSGSTKKGKLTIHKNCNSKTGSNRSQVSTQQPAQQPSSKRNHSLTTSGNPTTSSKGDHTTKGGNCDNPPGRLSCRGGKKPHG
jgi:hypothetical protein